MQPFLHFALNFLALLLCFNAGSVTRYIVKEAVDGNYKVTRAQAYAALAIGLTVSFLFLKLQLTGWFSCFVIAAVGFFVRYFIEKLAAAHLGPKE
jgi:hypothetical protein